MYMYLNGEYLLEEEARISPLDHGFLYGLGIFETMRTYNGHPFLIDDHLARMNEALQAMKININVNRELIGDIIGNLSERNQLSDSYLRLNVSAGEGSIGLQTDAYENPTIILFQKELPPVEPLKEKELLILNIKRNTPETSKRFKSHHFFNNVAAKREVGESPNREGLFLTELGEIAEGVTSNIFWVKHGHLYTPSLDTGILDGITRRYVLSVARKLGIPVHVGLYSVDELRDAAEIFLTNSIQEIAPVSQFEEARLPGKQGEIVRKLYHQYVQDRETRFCL